MMLLHTSNQKESLWLGYAVGERAGAFIFEADSNAELDSLLESLPYWGLIKINVTPLVGDRG